MPDDVLHSVVFFIGDCEFKTPMPPNVLSRGLCGYIQSFREQVFSPQEAGDILARLARAKAAPIATHALHVSGLRERHGGSYLSEMRVGPCAQNRPKGCQRGRLVFRLLGLSEMPLHPAGLSGFRGSENMTPRLKMGVNQRGLGPRVERASVERAARAGFSRQIRARRARRESAPPNGKLPATLVFMGLRGR